MSNFEYKTVALPRSVAKRKRRRQSEADLVAEQLGKTLNDEAIDGWEYVRAETLTTPGQRGLLKQGVPAAYVVLIFKRMREGAWKRAEQAPQQRQAEPQREPVHIPQAPQRPQAERAEPMVAPKPPAPAAAPNDPSEVRFGTTSVQLVSSGDGNGSVTPMRPLGSAQD